MRHSEASERRDKEADVVWNGSLFFNQGSHQMLWHTESLAIQFLFLVHAGPSSQNAQSKGVRKDSATNLARALS